MPLREACLDNNKRAVLRVTPAVQSLNLVGLGMT